MVKEIDWRGSWTLTDYLVKLVRDKKVDSEEFKALERLYGREHLKKIWLEEKKKRISQGKEKK